MKQLIYNKKIDRYLIVGDGEERELHCGNAFEVLIGDNWVRTVIEMQWCNGKGKYYLTTRALSLENIVAYNVSVR